MRHCGAAIVGFRSMLAKCDNGSIQGHPGSFMGLLPGARGQTERSAAPASPPTFRRAARLRHAVPDVPAPPMSAGASGSIKSANSGFDVAFVIRRGAFTRWSGKDESAAQP
jgi:hypothetical protein